MMMLHSSIVIYGLLLLSTLADHRTLAAPPGFAAAHLKPTSLAANPGLYTDSDDVITLAAATFQSVVFRQEHGTLVEFYNAFCGFCKRYAPHWKAFAVDVRDWSNVVRVAAIDCANEQNSELCREYEVMSYPTLRYFGPLFADAKNYGQPIIQTDALPLLRAQLAAAVRNQSAATAGTRPAGWPQLDAPEQPLAQMLATAPAGVRLTFVVYELATDQWLASELALDFQANRWVRVMRVESAQVAATYGLLQSGSAAVVTQQLDAVPLTLLAFDRETLRTTMRRFVREHGLEMEATPAASSVVASSTDAAAAHRPHGLEQPSGTVDAQRQQRELLAYVKRHEPTVYMADIQHALWYAVGHEITLFSVIDGERLEALKRFVAVLSKYVPLPGSGPDLLRELDAFVGGATILSGQQIQNTLTDLKHKWELTETTDAGVLRWIGCRGSVPNSRGYTCGLWVLFHFLTVQAAHRADMAATVAIGTGDAVQPTEVLQAVHGYVKHFFGCTDCSQHFQRMATERNVWQVRTPAEAVLWLWRAHNEVNARLAGDTPTNDPLFPKVAYPRESECQVCRNGSGGAGSRTNASEVRWVDAAVLPHLLHVYAAQNLSYYGIPMAAKASSTTFGGASMPSAQPLVGGRRMLDSVFSDLDMRMGILLYVFCIGMLMAAVKLFVRQRGYRKKMYYTRELMGKV